MHLETRSITLKRHLLHDSSWVPNYITFNTTTNVPRQSLSPMTVKIQNEKLLYSLAIHFCPLRKIHPTCQNNSNNTNENKKSITSGYLQQPLIICEERQKTFLNSDFLPQLKHPRSCSMHACHATLADLTQSTFLVQVYVFG